MEISEHCFLGLPKRFGVDLPQGLGLGAGSGWEGCGVGDSTFLHLVTWKVERQRASHVAKARRRFEWSQGIVARCAAEGWPQKVKPEGRGEATHMPLLEEIVLPASLLYTNSCFYTWFSRKSLHLLALLSGGAKRKTECSTSAGERQARRSDQHQRPPAVAQTTLPYFFFFQVLFSHIWETLRKSVNSPQKNI